MKVNEDTELAVPTTKSGRTLEPLARYELMAQPDYGYDCYLTQIQPERGYVIVAKGDVIQPGDKPWDVYAGWMESDGYHARMGHHARSYGRWTCWERPVTSDTEDNNQCAE